MKIQFETINCPLCNSEESKPKLRAPDRFDLKNGKTYQIVSCSNCSFVYLNPRPRANSISEFYTSEQYQPFLSTQSSMRLWDRIYKWTRALSVGLKRRKIEKFRPKGAILDVGCGTGEFLKEMHQNGWQATGIEKDKRAAEFAQKSYGLNVFTCGLEEVNSLSKTFDVITFWHVLEHVYDPTASLQIARNMLTDEGLILLAAPNIASFDSSFYGENWVALDAPRHLLHFVPASVNALCGEAELDILEFHQMVLDAFFNCLMSETLIAARMPKKKIFLPLYLLRGLIIAMVSLTKSSRLRAKNNRQGSSNLYFIQKQKSG